MIANLVEVLGVKSSVWSYGNVDFSAKPEFSDATTFVYSENWGEPVSLSVNGISTWAEAFQFADTAIRMSGDSHHVFIENFHYTEETKTVELSCGS